MSETELKRYIDDRTPHEREWIFRYLRDTRMPAPELVLTDEKVAELDRRIDEMKAGINRVSQAEMEARFDELDRSVKGENDLELRRVSGPSRIAGQPRWSGATKIREFFLSLVEGFVSTGQWRAPIEKRTHAPIQRRRHASCVLLDRPR